MQNSVHVFPGQVQPTSIVTCVWDSSWHSSLAGISFLSTQLVITFNCQLARNISCLKVIFPRCVHKITRDANIYSV
jgi:hypothetical protein